MIEIDMDDSQNIVIQKALYNAFGQPIEREENEYGCSGVGFCLKKQGYERLWGIQPRVNGNMWIGKIVHAVLPEIIAQHPYGILHGETKTDRWRHRKYAPQFEIKVKYADDRMFKIGGHVDAWIPMISTVIELKTTAMNKVFQVGDFITDAYCTQANAYASILGAERWEIWIINKEFEDMSNFQTHSFISVISGDTDPYAFELFLDRVFLIESAVYLGQELVGPEQEWECKNCECLNDCSNWKEIIPQFESLLPADKATLTSTGELTKVFNIFSEKHVIKYNRELKQYEFRKEEEQTEDQD